MLAAVLRSAGAQIRVEEMPLPSPVVDGVILEVFAVPVPSYTKHVFAGALPGRRRLPTPFIPGLSAIGRVHACGPSARRVAEGDIVFADPQLPAATDASGENALLIGWVAPDSCADDLLATWRNGSLAQFAHYPEQCLTRIPPALAGSLPALSVLHVLSIAHAGLGRAAMQPGDAVVVTGSTGNIGSAVVLDALARGAARVVAVGRNSKILSELAEWDSRVKTVATASRNSADVHNAIVDASGGQCNVHVDAIGSTKDHGVILAAIAALGRLGTSVLLGGARGAIPLNYLDVMRREITVRGSYMYRRDVPHEVLMHVADGALSLDRLDVATFGLHSVAAAVSAAADRRGPHYVSVNPQLKA